MTDPIEPIPNDEHEVIAAPLLSHEVLLAPPTLPGPRLLWQRRGQQLAAVRKAAGSRQTDAAATAGLTQSVWSHLEQGKQTMGDRQWARLFLAAGLSEPRRSQITAICQELDDVQRESQEAAEKAIALTELLRSELDEIPEPNARRP